jgi:hypothetical protein
MSHFSVSVTAAALASVVLFSASASARIVGIDSTCTAKNEYNELFIGKDRSKIRSISIETASQIAIEKCEAKGSLRCEIVSCKSRTVRSRR